MFRSENPLTHFCVYFAAHDSAIREVFIGHHKKSGLWLFNGGHLDKGETPAETLKREIGEEWGLDFDIRSIGRPFLLTITPINHPEKMSCKLHYDFWYKVKVDKRTFHPNYQLLVKEFYEMKWVEVEDALKLVKDPNTLHAITIICNKIYI